MTTAVYRARCEVLIVGLGPVGVTLAALLGRMGVTVLAIEREPIVFPLPRAAHIDHEIMRIFQSIGMVEDIRPHIRVAPDYEFWNACGDVLMRIERDRVIGASGWPVGFNIYQPGIEDALRRGLEGLDTVDAHYGVAFDAIVANGAAGAAGAAVMLLQGHDRNQVEARFVVACDGASSPVREACGIDLDDYLFDEPWLVLDTVAGDGGFPKANIQRCDPERPTSFIHMGPGRLRWEFMLKPHEDPSRMKTDDAIAELLKPWRVGGDIQVERAAVYRFHGLVAQTWRQASIFLAGDAAHQMPPFMGQGLCSGLRDAANLAWKLRTVIEDERAEALLDTYQGEREPHVRFVIERAIEMGRMVCTLDPDVAASRDNEMLAQPRIGGPVQLPPLAEGCLMPGTPGAGEIFPQPVDRAVPIYLDDVLGPGAWLISLAEPRGLKTPPELRLVDPASDLPPALAAPIKAWLAEHAVEAVLVRPDRYVFGSGLAASLVEQYAVWHGQREVAGDR